MPVAAVLEIIFQVYFAVHAVRTGRDRYWLFIIVFFPGIGCLIYFFAEFLPCLQQSSRMGEFKHVTGSSLNAGRHLRMLQEQVEMTPSIKNKKRLAEAYVNGGQFDKGIDLYRQCLQEAQQEDPHLLEGLSCAYFFKGDFEQAKQYLTRLLGVCESYNAGPFHLLMARTLEGLGEMETAKAKYAQVVKTFSGEEARCRYALLLKQLGQTEAADKLFAEILKNARLSPKYYRRTQKTWIDIARKEKI